MDLVLDDSSDTSPLSVCYHPVRPMEVEQPLRELEWIDFVDSLRSGFLPKDGEGRSPFDHTLRFEISDPHATDGGIPRGSMTHPQRQVGRIGICCSSICCNTVNTCSTMILCTFWWIQGI